MFSSFVIGEHDAEGDGVLDAAEIANVWENAFANLEEHGYFTHLRVGEELLRLDRVRDSAATIEGEVLI